LLTGSKANAKQELGGSRMISAD